MVVYIINLVVLLIFLLSYIQDRRKLVNGFLFLVLLFFTGISLITYTFTSENAILVLLVTGLLFLFLLVMVFGLFIIMLVSFINARVLIRKEGRKLTNLLSLFVGLGILLWIIINTWNIQSDFLGPLFSALLLVVDVFGVYILMMFAIFMISSYIYSIYRPRLKQDYIIVLGAGLLNGKTVTPLLARRIDKGITLYNKQIQKKKKPIQFIMSGGKGPDEKLSEAEAMKQYAVSQGVLEEHIIVEDKSKNTYENMKFSKEIIEKRSTKKKPRVLYTTTNYHVFRAGIYAKRAGLRAQGIGARTPFYFWYNAILREFVAIIIMHRKSQLIILISLVVLCFGGYLILSSPDVIKRIIEILGIK